MFSCVRSSVLFLCSLCFSPVSSFVCSGEVYGNPNIGDCGRALLEIPHARQPVSSHRARVFHIFAEPQFQHPPFPLVTNNFRPAAIIQLPKIWKQSTSHIDISHPPSRVCDRLSYHWLNLKLRLLPHSSREPRYFGDP